ncbi:MAG TPA: DUF3445 domain-containing protein [Rhodobacteraceae bacterium]|nr:DUF3445 domain-containing protein [Paracoccaceae bacterium]
MDQTATRPAPILQRTIPYGPRAPQRLPGIAPMAMEDWLPRDDAFAAQMALRDRLIGTRRAAVLALDDSARPAARELQDMVLALAWPGAGDAVTRPDGVRVPVDRDDPLATLGRIAQQDFCILQKPEGAEEHLLTGAVLCFPASWWLDEKFLRLLIGIHAPVAEYDADLARRVQRLFDGIQPGRPLWRFNALWYDDPALHQPRREGARRDPVDPATARYLRSEWQCLVRLPETGAVVFSIHTYVLSRETVVGMA